MSDRELRDLLETTQAELERAKVRLKELEAQSTETLQERVTELEAVAVTMHARLEQGDAVRETWANRQTVLERDLAISRIEQQRLLSQLENVTLDQQLGIPIHRNRNMVLALLGAVSAGAIALLVAMLN